MSNYATKNELDHTADIHTSDIAALHKKSPYSELFWSIFSRIWTEYGEIQSTYLYSVQMWEKTDGNKSEYGHFSCRAAQKDSLNNLKTKVDDLDVGKLKTVPIDLKKLSDVEDNEVLKNTKFNTLKTKVNNLEKKIPDATTLLHINECNTDKQNLGKKLEMLIKKNRYKWFSDYNCFEYKNWRS